MGRGATGNVCSRETTLEIVRISIEMELFSIGGDHCRSVCDSDGWVIDDVPLLLVDASRRRRARYFDVFISSSLLFQISGHRARRCRSFDLLSSIQSLIKAFTYVVLHHTQLDRSFSLRSPFAHRWWVWEGVWVRSSSITMRECTSPANTPCPSWSKRTNERKSWPICCWPSVESRDFSPIDRPRTVIGWSDQAWCWVRGERESSRDWPDRCALAGIPSCALLENPVAEQLKLLTRDGNSTRAKPLLTSWGRIQLGKLALVTGGAIVFYWLARR